MGLINKNIIKVQAGEMGVKRRIALCSGGIFCLIFLGFFQ
jgi:hypothetical protein